MDDKELTLNILLVEDNLDHAELVLRSLENDGIAEHVQHVHDGESALDYLFRRKRYANTEAYPVPHLVLLDLRLPKIDGIEVLSSIKSDEELRKIPVIILTTSEAESDLAKAYSHYANSYLVKPPDFKRFRKLLQDVSQYWLMWNRQP